MEQFYRNYAKAHVQHDAALGGLPNPNVLFGSPIGLYPSPHAHKLSIMKGFNTLQTGGRHHKGSRLAEEIPQDGGRKGKGFLGNILGPFSMFNKGGKRKHKKRHVKAKKGKGILDVLTSLLGGHMKK